MSYNLLIIEDNPNDAELITIALGEAKLGKKAFICENGAEALDFIFSKGKYAGAINQINLKAIFLDLKMPKVNGLEVLKQVKSNKTTKRIPVIVVTSSSQYSDISTAYDLGVNSYIVKPVDFDEFQRKITVVASYWLNENIEPMNQ
ncbi:MAG: response regulator [Bacteroidales bacterium]